MRRGGPRDHGGGLDAARAQWGGDAGDWIDLSTGINPVAYPLPVIPGQAWAVLPDRAAADALTDAARAFWDVPDGAAILAAPGASALIARMPGLASGARVRIDAPTYNEHAAAFRAHGFEVTSSGDAAARVVVHPNNPDGRLWDGRDRADLTIVDESFCDTMSETSHVDRTAEPGFVILKSFGKFWGLAGLRLGFAIAHPDTLAPLTEALGPWPVSGPGLVVGTAALRDGGWAETTRARLRADAARLDATMRDRGRVVGGTDLFRLYETEDAAAMQARLAEARIWTRVFPWSDRWIRLGLPAPARWTQVESALG